MAWRWRGTTRTGRYVAVTLHRYPLELGSLGVSISSGRSSRGAAPPGATAWGRQWAAAAYEWSACSSTTMAVSAAAPAGRWHEQPSAGPTALAAELDAAVTLSRILRSRRRQLAVGAGAGEPRRARLLSLTCSLARSRRSRSVLLLPMSVACTRLMCLPVFRRSTGARTAPRSAKTRRSALQWGRGMHGRGSEQVADAVAGHGQGPLLRVVGDAALGQVRTSRSDHGDVLSATDHLA
jgi:hypothetical protein